MGVEVDRFRVVDHGSLVGLVVAGFGVGVVWRR
jgi:hypothetical protein